MYFSTLTIVHREFNKTNTCETKIYKAIKPYQKYSRNFFWSKKTSNSREVEAKDKEVHT
jgi:hypothetical protein